MNKSRWNRSRAYRQSKSLKKAYKVGDLVMYCWTQRYDGGSPDDELCVVLVCDPEPDGLLTIKPVSGECAFLVNKSEVSCVG